MIYQKEREAVASTMRRLYKQGLTTCSGGNISFRASDNHILITPSALDKGIINYRQIALMTLQGENFSAGLKPSIETDMHLKILRNRPDINAIVHAHPVHASFFTTTGKEGVNTALTAEARFLLGETVFAPYALMGTEDLGERVSNALKEGAHAVFLENHGVLTLGKTLLQAFDRLEVLESAARMTLLEKLYGSAKSLSHERLSEIDAMHD